MAIHVTHELHKRRFSRNLGLGLVLGAFVVLVFALSVVKVTRGDPMKGYDHKLSSGHLPAVGSEEPAAAGAPAVAVEPAPAASSDAGTQP